MRFFCSHTVKVCTNLRASTYDLIDYLRPTVQKQSKALVIHTGTYKIQHEVNAIKMVKNFVKVIKERDSENETEIKFFGSIQREDHYICD